MTPEEIAALAAENEKLKSDLAQKDGEIATFKTNLEGVVDELKSVRKSKQEIEAERDSLKSTTQPKPAESNDAEAVFKKLMDEERAKKAKNAFESAETKFKNAHKEFASDNDPGGIKYAAFKQRLSRFNLQGLETEEDYLTVFAEVLTLMGVKTEVPGSMYKNPYTVEPTSPGQPKSVENSSLSDKEKNLIKDMGWTEDRYLKLKKSRPHYVESLLVHVK